MPTKHSLKLCLVLVVTLGAGVGCSSRASQDMITYNSLAGQDRAFIDTERARVPTGGNTILTKQPRWVYMNGALVDTNNAQWMWEETPASKMSGEQK